MKEFKDRRTLTLLVIVLVFFLVSLNANEMGRGFNVFSAIGSGGLVGKDVDDRYESKMNLAFGMTYADYTKTSAFMIEPGVSFLMTGSKAEITEGELITSAEFTFYYLDFFLKAKYKGRRLNPYLGLGISLCTEVNAKININGNKVSRDATKVFKELNYPFMIGSDLLLTNELSLGIQYSRFLNNIPDLAGAENFKISIHKIMAIIGYRFNI